MTTAEFRRWVVWLIEKAIKTTFAMIVMSLGCIATAYIVSGCLRLLGVA